MNANELADELKYIAKVLNMNTDVDTQPIITTASLLLQQQAAIEALKKQVIGDLTDEEITAMWYEPTLRYDPVAFARAILRKAQEK
jgi:hypothetical protein